MSAVWSFIKRHWLWSLLLLLLLWLLPKLINALANLLTAASAYVREWGGAAKVLGDIPEKVANAIDKVATLARQPLLLWLVPVLVFRASPVFGAALAVWNLLDLFKGDETMTITRTKNVSPSPASAPAPAPGSPPPTPAGNDFAGFLS